MIEKSEILKMYLNGKSAYEILPLTDYKSVHSIYNIVRKNGHEVRIRAGVKNLYLKHNYFENVNTEHKAYWLGFLMADGCIEKRNKSQTSIGIEIKNIDKYLLEEWKKDIGTNNKIANTRKGCCRIRVHSNKMADDLSKYNIVPNKSHRENHIIKLKEPFMSPFIRGMFDGDGWIYMRKEYGNLTFGLCGTFTTMADIEEYLRYELKIPKVKVCNYKNKVPFFTHYSKNSLERIYKYLYTNSTIYLKRKKEIFDKIYANTEVTN